MQHPRADVWQVSGLIYCLWWVSVSIIESPTFWHGIISLKAPLWHFLWLDKILKYWFMLVPPTFLSPLHFRQIVRPFAYSWWLFLQSKLYFLWYRVLSFDKYTVMSLPPQPLAAQIYHPENPLCCLFVVPLSLESPPLVPTVLRPFLQCCLFQNCHINGIIQCRALGFPFFT